MSWYWVIYWISVGVVILFSTIVRRLFTLEGNTVSRIKVIMASFVSFIPIVGTLEALFGLGFFFTALLEEDLKFKEHPFRNDKLNEFLMN